MQVGLIGASNVGKSTLFNRLIGQFRAIVTDIPGTTQDILYHKTKLNDNLNDKSINLIFADSPGLLSFDEEWPFIKRLLLESDLVFFVIDEKLGFTAKEQYINEFIMNNGYKNKVVLLLNKVDKATNYDDEILIVSNYFKYGYDKVFITSAKQGKNISRIRQVIFDYAKENDFFDKENSYNDVVNIENKDIEEISITENKRLIESKKSEYFNIAIVGKPNSGKSTLLNTIAGKYISKVQDKPGTTLDYVVYDVEFEGEKFTLYDTAGIRRKGKSHGLEAIAYEKTLNMLKYIHPPVLFLIDGDVGLTHRDMTLLKEIHQIGVPLVIGINKIDVLSSIDKKRIEVYIRDHLPFLHYVSIVSLSAKTGKNIKKILKEIKLAYNNSYTFVKTSKLNDIVHRSFITNPPRFPKNKICKILYMTQVSMNPCRFKVFINHKSRANFSFKRWLENILRKNFGFEGNPVQLDFIERERRRLDKKFSSGMR